MRGSFFFITKELEFQESTKKGARILATFMELDTPSANGRIYRFVEGKKIAQSLVGKPIRYGASPITGKHFGSVPIIGKVESAWQIGKKIKGIVHIWEASIVETLKRGTKYLFSVGGVAEIRKMVRKGKRMIATLYNAVCSHLQLLPNDPEGAGFPSAKMHKIIEINESVMLVENKMVCGPYGCKILKAIRADFEEAKRKAIKREIVLVGIKAVSEKIA